MVIITAVQASGKVLTDVFHIEYLFSIITPLTCNAETARSVIYGSDGGVHRTTSLMGTLGVDLGAGESSNNTADPVSGAAEGESSTSITPFSDALRE